MYTLQGTISVWDGINLSAPLPSSVHDETVLVPLVTLPHAELCLQLSRYNLEPLIDDSNFGITLSTGFGCTSMMYIRILSSQFSFNYIGLKHTCQL